jgi:signal transduction histidine kinase
VVAINQDTQVQSLPLDQSQTVPASLINRVSRSLTPVVIFEATTHPELAIDLYILRQKPLSILCTPILQQGQLVAILYLENRTTKGVFTNDRLEVIQLLTAQAAISIKNARLFAQEQARTRLLQEQTRMLAFRSEIDAALMQDMPLSEILQRCTQITVAYLDAAFARIWTLNELEQVLELQASAGLYTHIDGPHSRVPVGQFKIGLIAAERQPHLTNAVLDDPRVGDKAWAKRENMVAFAGYPLMVNQRLLGVIALFSRQPLSDSTLTTLAFVVGQISLGIQRKQTELTLQRSEAQLRQQSEQLEQTLHNLQQAQLQIVQGEKMSALGSLVAGVAHEINNPVGFLNGNLKPALAYIQDLFGLLDLYQTKYPAPDLAIQNQIELIDLDFLRQDLPKLIGSMKEGVDRIRNISTSLRTFSRADSDYPVAFKLQEGIDSTLLILKHRLKANEFRPEILVNTQYAAIPAVECFAGQLNQVFMNLLANAIDALDESCQDTSFNQLRTVPKQITVITELSTDQQSVIVRIQDNGMGIPAAVQAKIFDHLFTTKPVGKGTGLGLAIAHQIVVEKHQGSLAVNSALGQGTEFVITLPVKTPVAPAEVKIELSRQCHFYKPQ